ncbi:hypothetical protein MNBD_ALPHA11-670 [hydrothermal vent metagenome]|uniref:Uncharacterized protein n=1 Tax=hydrothermal vent metagenome TaxID=652676 RepID=A0A3B0UEP8_9ZZZZ
MSCNFTFVEILHQNRRKIRQIGIKSTQLFNSDLFHKLQR